MFKNFILILLIAGCSNEPKESSPTSIDPQNTTGRNRVDSVKSREIGQDQLPDKAKFKGQFVSAYTWVDKQGESIVVFSSMPQYRSPKLVMNEDETSAELHVSRFRINTDKTIQRTWKWEGGVMNCPFDIVSEFIGDATTITDLDKDGVAELCFQAMEVCRSDVSPSDKRLFIVEDDKVYSLKGAMWIPQGPHHEMNVNEKNVNLETQPKPKEDWQEYTLREGRYETEKEFASAPKEFLIHARSQWLKFIKESFD